MMLAGLYEIGSTYSQQFAGSVQKPAFHCNLIKLLSAI
jgi:hypothetical protein